MGDSGKFVVGRSQAMPQKVQLTNQDLGVYVQNLRETFFYSINQYFSNFTAFRESQFVLIFCRAIYIT